MKLIFILYFSFVLKFLALGQDVKTHYYYVNKADSLNRINLSAEAFRLYERSLSYLSNNDEVYTSLASIALKLGRKEKSHKYLIKSIENGSLLASLLNDELIKAHFNQKWHSIYANRNQKYLSKIPHQAVRTTLIKMLEKDQNLRGLLGVFDFKRVDSLIHLNDLYNLKKMKLIIEKIGFPDKSKVGKDGSDATFILLSHLLNSGSNDEENGKNLFPIIEKSVKNGQFRPFYYAILVDRQKGINKKPQIFGTYWEFDKSGKKVITEIANINFVEQRRAEIGLPSLRSVINSQKLIPPNDFIN